MSSISVNTITDASGGATTSINGFTPSVSNMAGRNRIINGDMRVAQRGTAAVTVNAASSFFAVDRFSCYGQAGDGVFTIQQSTVAPSGFVNSLLATTTTQDTSIDASQIYLIRHRIEGLNVADFGWGTANAKTITLSFWVRSSLTGTFGGSIRNGAQDRSYPFSYTINAANTWEQKSITIAGDTSGTWLTDTGVGLQVSWSLGSGSSYKGTAGVWAGASLTSVTGAVEPIGTSGATFYITGVQLEAGSVATPFEHRQYGQELALCQRYYEVMGEPFGFGRVNATPAVRFFARYTVIKRATPTITGVGSFSCSDMFTTDTTQSANQGISIVVHVTTSGAVFGFNASTLSSSAPFTNGVVCANLNNGAVVIASAEL